MSILDRKLTTVRFWDVIDASKDRLRNECSPPALMACQPKAERAEGLFSHAMWFCNQVRTRIEADEAAAAHQALKAKAANENKSRLILPGDDRWSN